MVENRDVEELEDDSSESSDRSSSLDLTDFSHREEHN